MTALYFFVIFFTIGHSTRSLPEFLGILKIYGVNLVVDVRAFPSSRRCPHFSRQDLARSLKGEGVEYVWLGKELGGYRKTGLGEASPNKAWSSQGFQNFADHMLTEEFLRGMRRLIALAEGKKAALLCAEKFWWRCHRRLLSDWLVTQGHKVVHILDAGKVVEHELPPFARVEAGRVIYPKKDLWNPG